MELSSFYVPIHYFYISCPFFPLLFCAIDLYCIYTYVCVRSYSPINEYKMSVLKHNNVQSTLVLHNINLYTSERSCVYFNFILKPRFCVSSSGKLVNVVLRRWPLPLCSTEPFFRKIMHCPKHCTIFSWEIYYGGAKKCENDARFVLLNALLN